MFIILIFQIINIFFINFIFCSDVENKVKIPDALTPEQFQKVDKLLNNQDYLNYELKDQLNSLGKLNHILSGGGYSPEKLRYQSLINDDSLIFNQSTIEGMEAPVIYLEPPLVLPKEQIKTDEEVEKFLKASGLENITKDMSNNPFNILTIDEAKTSEKAVKSRVNKLKAKREELFEKMRKLSLEMTGTGTSEEFDNLNKSIKRLDNILKGEIEKLTQVELVKKALINKRGPGTDVEAKEMDLEEKEEEMEHDQQNHQENENDEENQEANGEENPEEDEEDY